MIVRFDHTCGQRWSDHLGSPSAADRAAIRGGRRALLPHLRAQVRHGWRLALVREPASRESQVLALSLAKYRTVYESDEEAAKALLATGESSRDKTLAPAEHAAWTMIAQTILNLDETITQP